MVVLLYYYLELWDVHASWCICEYVCYYVELRLILLLVMCLSYRYGRQSTPEHNYLALQKSLCPQGMTKQREMVMLHAVGWNMHIGVVLTTARIGVVDSRETETLMRLHKKKKDSCLKKNHISI